jgi:hypothetical protein
MRLDGSCNCACEQHVVVCAGFRPVHNQVSCVLLVYLRIVVLRACACSLLYLLFLAGASGSSISPRVSSHDIRAGLGGLQPMACMFGDVADSICIA